MKYIPAAILFCAAFTLAMCGICTAEWTLGEKYAAASILTGMCAFMLIPLGWFE